MENDFIRTSFVLQSAKVSVSGYCLLISSRLYLNFKGPLGTHVHSRAAQTHLSGKLKRGENMDIYKFDCVGLYFSPFVRGSVEMRGVVEVG